MAIDISAIPQIGRNLQRVAAIAAILVKYGFADQIKRIDSRFVHRWLRDTQIEQLAGVTHEARIRLVLTELGTTFIKLGQMLSTRRDLVGPELAEELSHLQARVPADAFDITKATIEEELGQPLENLFASLEREPLASASIGQVHRARLADGRTVAVKVQHPGIGARVRDDLAILREIARLAQDYIPELRSYRPVAVVAEFERTLLQELDFRRECRYLQIFNRNFEKDEQVRFPAPLPELSTSRVLTMTYLAGTPVRDLPRAAATGLEPAELGRRGARIFLDMIFRDGFYHADPHPGNLLILPNGVLGILDGGMIGRIDATLRSQIESAIIAVMSNDPATLAELVIRVGDLPPHFDPASLQTDLAEKIEYYWGMPLDQFQLSTAVEEFTEAIRRYQIMLPPPMAMLLKVMVMLEGTTRLVNPRFNLVEVLEPYRRKFLFRRFSRKQITRDLVHAARDWEEIARGVPRLIRDLMVSARKQQFAIQLQHQHLEPSVNRLVFGLMVSSLFVGSSMLWSRSVPPLIWDTSLFGVAGCTLSVILGYRLFRAIQKSGRLEDNAG